MTQLNERTVKYIYVLLTIIANRRQSFELICGHTLQALLETMIIQLIPRSFDGLGYLENILLFKN